MRNLIPLLASLLLAGCGGGEGDAPAGPNATAENEATGAPAEPLDPDEAAALADEAAADEAADMGTFGGNAAAGGTGNGS